MGKCREEILRVVEWYIVSCRMGMHDAWYVGNVIKEGIFV